MRRQSRVSREIVSSHQGLHLSSFQLFVRPYWLLDNGLSVVPTREWQENLSKRLAYGSTSSTVSPPLMQKWRPDNANEKPTNWDSLYTIEPTLGTSLRPSSSLFSLKYL